MSLETRSKINTKLVILGGLVVISGVFLFFHFESFLVKFIHEVGGALLIAACVSHLKMNWTALTKSLAERLALKTIFAIYVVMTLLMVISVIKEANF